MKRMINEDFVLPNYRNGSIVNLMSSIAGAFGTKMQYAELAKLPSKNLKGSKNIVLLVIDGLGYNYLMKREGFLKNHNTARITSVFPATTASAITTFSTGAAPQQHAVTGWFMNLKEIGSASVILKFSSMISDEPFSRRGFLIENVIREKSFAQKIKAKCFCVMLDDLVDTDYSRLTQKKSTTIRYRSLNGLFAGIRKAISSGNKRKYIYAYWPFFDLANHKHGPEGKKVLAEFREFDREIERFANFIKGTGTTLIVTSDHGFVHVPEEKVVRMKHHPRLAECLTLPICGDSRVGYCYVRPGKVRQFENYVNTRMKRYCTMIKSEDAIRKGFFGLFRPNRRLYDRIGDYILLSKRNIAIKNSMNIVGAKKSGHIGRHSGVTGDEMYVPLIIIKR